MQGLSFKSPCRWIHYIIRDKQQTMEKITLHKNGQLKGREKIINPPVYKYLSSVLTCEDEVCLDSFFMMIETYPELRTLSDLLDPLLMMARDNATPGYKTDEIDHLIFYKTIAMKGFPGEPGIDIYTRIKGVKNDTETDLKFFQITDLLEHNLKFGQLRHIIFGDGQDSFSYETRYTLFEVIEGVSWELSFNFNPKQCVLRR
jgi:hypothetical protein